MDINDIGSTDMDGWDTTTKEMANNTQWSVHWEKSYYRDKDGYLRPIDFKDTFLVKTCKSRKLSFPNLSTGGNLE